MAERITASEFIDPSLLKEMEKLNKQLQIFIGNQKELMNQVIKTDVEIKKGVNSHKQLSDNLDKVNKNAKKLSDVEKEIIKLNKDLENEYLKAIQYGLKSLEQYRLIG